MRMKIIERHPQPQPVKSSKCQKINIVTGKRTKRVMSRYDMNDIFSMFGDIFGGHGGFGGENPWKARGTILSP